MRKFHLNSPPEKLTEVTSLIGPIIVSLFVALFTIYGALIYKAERKEEASPIANWEEYIRNVAQTARKRWATTVRFMKRVTRR